MADQGDTRAVIGTQELAALTERAADQHARLTGPPIPVDFTYDRNCQADAAPQDRQQQD